MIRWSILIRVNAMPRWCVTAGRAGRLAHNQRAPRVKGLRTLLGHRTGGHEVFSLDRLRIPIPNHREIAEGTPRSIMRQAAAKLGEDWWR